MQDRIDWIDQAKGFAILLVVYGHNFPITEQWIYTFHMPLFFMISGFFFPTQLNFSVIIKRFKTIMIPYLFWAFFLFGFWFLIGRKMGSSGNENLSVLQNFIGIFYSQGGKQYMDWGIPMWFLPCMFLTYTLYYFIRKSTQNKPIIFCLSTTLMILSFVFTRWIGGKLPWSINVSLVALFFMMIGNLTYPTIQKWDNQKTKLILPILVLVHVGLYFLNSKVDMYRSIYGHNEIVFVLNGLVGSFAAILFFKAWPKFKFLATVGKFTLLILALQLLALSFIKLVLWKGFGITNFSFSETEKFIYALLQIALIYPVFLIINRYLPILNGTTQKI